MSGKSSQPQAHDENVVTAGDLRSLAGRFPKEEFATDSYTKMLAETIGTVLEDALFPLREEIVRLRVRMRVLIGMLHSRDLYALFVNVRPRF